MGKVHGCFYQKPQDCKVSAKSLRCEKMLNPQQLLLCCIQIFFMGCQTVAIVH